MTCGLSVPFFVAEVLQKKFFELRLHAYGVLICHSALKWKEFDAETVAAIFYGFRK